MQRTLKHYTSNSFWEDYKLLPLQIQELADKSFENLKQNHFHPSLHFKKIKQFWSVRIGSKYRALAVEKDENLLWFWIGSHSEYDKLIK